MTKSAPSRLPPGSAGRPSGPRVLPAEAPLPDEPGGGPDPPGCRHDDVGEIRRSSGWTGLSSGRRDKTWSVSFSASRRASMTVEMAGWVMAFSAARASGSGKTMAARAARSSEPSGVRMPGPNRSTSGPKAGPSGATTSGRYGRVDQHGSAPHQEISDRRLPDRSPPVKTDGEHCLVGELSLIGNGAHRERSGLAGHGQQDEGRLVDILGDEEVVVVIPVRRQCRTGP